MRALAAALMAAFLLAGCAVGYENENGPRGPERFTAGAEWPEPPTLGCEGCEE